MMRAIAAACLFVIGCSSAGEDPAPVLEVTSPARGTVADAETVTVTGRVTDNGPVRVTVGGMDVTPGPDGTFEATLAVPPGISLIETHAIDKAGNDVRDVRAVLAGTLAPSDGSVAGQLGARAGAGALRAVGDAVAASANQIDYTAAAQPLNPVYDNGGCLGATINITSIDLSNVGVTLAPQTGALSTDVVIENLVVKLAARFKVACIGGSTTITLRASKAKIHGDLGLRVANMALATSLPAATVSFEGFSLDIGGVPGAIEDLLRGQARSGVEKALASTIRDRVPPIADGALAGMLAKPLTAGILGHDTTFGITPKSVSITPTELFVAVETSVSVQGGEGGTFLTTPTSLSAAAMGGANGLGIALDDDVLNGMFAGLWAASAFDQQIAIDSIPALGALLDDDGRTLDLAMSLPPTVSTAGGDLELALGDLIITVRDEAGAEVQKMAISVRTMLAAAPSQTGKIVLTVGAPEVFAQVLSNSDVVDSPLTDSEVEALVTAVWGLIGVEADNALSNLPMPTIGGVTFGAPTLAAGDGFVLADVPVE